MKGNPFHKFFSAVKALDDIFTANEITSFLNVIVEGESLLTEFPAGFLARLNESGSLSQSNAGKCICCTEC